jgi:hypothetical protein
MLNWLLCSLTSESVNLSCPCFPADYLEAMFREWRFEANLNKLQAKQRRNNRCYFKKIDEARDKKDKEEEESLRFEGSMENDNLRRDIDDLIASFLTSEAQRLLVPIPPRHDETMWEVEEAINRKVLTPLGIQTLRNDIHDEIKKKWERRFIWVQPISALLSLLIALGGVCAAVLSFLHHSKP